MAEIREGLGGPVRGHRRGSRWTSVSYGLHQPVGTGSRLPAWQLVLPPSGRFTSLTAARLYGWWLPPLPADLPVFAAIAHADSRPRRDGLRISRHADLAPPVQVQGVKVDPPAEVLVTCARHLGVLDTLVVLDAALHLGSCTAAEVQAVAASRRRGAPTLRRALSQADGRAESAWETLLRRLHESCGIHVEPQHELRDEHGAFLARADLWLVGTTTVHEYDGAHHLTRPQQRHDLARARRIGNQTWIRRGYTSADVLHQAIGILRDADLSLGRPHDAQRIRAWHSLLADSLFTPSGIERFRRRLGHFETGHRVRV